MSYKSNQDNSIDIILHSQLNRWWEIPVGIENVSSYIISRVEENSSNGRNLAIVNPLNGEKLDYASIPNISRSIASKFHKLGLKPGDTVISCTHDPVKCHVFMLGVWRANGVVGLVYPEELGDALVRRIKESRANFLACDAQNAMECLKAAQSIFDRKIGVIVFPDKRMSENQGFYSNCLQIEEFMNDPGESLPECTATLSDLALILPTSGTTGDSKGALYTHRILLHNILAHEHMPFTDKDSDQMIITSRQTHYCGSIVPLSCFTRGRNLLMMRSVSVPTLLETVHKFKVRSILAFPTYLIGMVNHPEVTQFDLSSLQFLTVAGQVIVPEALCQFKKLPNLKHFINLYGMTESGLLATTADWEAMKHNICKALDNEKPHSVGKLAPSSSLRVIDVDSGKSLGPNLRGELCFKTSITTAGYLNSPKEESETFSDDGWIKTGDIGYYDEDGFIFVVDRKKEIFKWNSNHVSPSEIESVLLRHPSVAQAVVIGVPGENDEGFIPRAFVVPKKENLVRVGLAQLKEEILLFAQNNLPPYKHLKGGIFLLTEIPVGKTGKVARKLLAEMELAKLPHCHE